MNFYQTGDLLYKEILALPKGSKVIKGNIIHNGNTGNAHTISGKASIYKNGEDLFLRVTAKSVLKHNEHKDVSLPKGFYKVEHVLERDHFASLTRKVVD